MHFGGIANAKEFGVAHCLPIIPMVPPASAVKVLFNAMAASAAVGILCAWCSLVQPGSQFIE